MTSVLTYLVKIFIHITPLLRPIKAPNDEFERKTRRGRSKAVSYEEKPGSEDDEDSGTFQFVFLSIQNSTKQLGQYRKSETGGEESYKEKAPRMRTTKRAAKKKKLSKSVQDLDLSDVSNEESAEESDNETDTSKKHQKKGRNKKAVEFDDDEDSFGNLPVDERKKSKKF